MSVKTTRVSMVETAPTRLTVSRASVRLGTMVPLVKQVCILFRLSYSCTLGCHAYVKECTFLVTVQCIIQCYLYLITVRFHLTDCRLAV